MTDSLSGWSFGRFAPPAESSIVVHAELEARDAAGHGGLRSILCLIDDGILVIMPRSADFEADNVESFDDDDDDDDVDAVRALLARMEVNVGSG